MKLFNLLLKKNTKETQTLITSEAEKISNELKELKERITILENRGVEMSNEFTNQNAEVINLIKNSKEIQENNFNQIIKLNLASFQENIIKIFEENLQEKKKFEEMEKKYCKIINENNLKLESQEIELNKYIIGFKPIKELLLSIDKLDSIKTNFYKKFKLLENDLTNNIIKLALKNKNEVVKASLMELRDIKVENKQEITSSEVEFYKAINKFFEKEMVLVERLEDREINSAYWNVTENTRHFAKKIFPPIDTGKDILRGVAKGEY